MNTLKFAAHVLKRLDRLERLLAHVYAHDDCQLEMQSLCSQLYSDYRESTPMNDQQCEELARELLREGEKSG